MTRNGQTERRSDPLALSLPLHYARDDWKLWIPGAILAFLLASVLMSGWPGGLIPNIAYPYAYQKDFLFHSWIAQRQIEGWVFDNVRSGYPFGSTFLDFPIPDTAHLLIFKIISLFTDRYYSSINIFFLLSFPIVYISSYIVSRAFGLNRWLATASSVLFTFLPFHFLRLGHTFYTWYFCIPIFFYIAWRLFDANPVPLSRFKISFYVISAICLFIISSFGVYYTLFGIITLGISSVASAIRFGFKSNFVIGIIFVALVSIGVIINVSPNLAYRYANGLNTEAVYRSPAAAETYGLKLIQLIYPRSSHRIEAARKYIDNYNTTHPLVNENKTSSLGLIGALGFAGGLLALLFISSGSTVDRRIAFFAINIFWLFLFGTIGGLGAVFSDLVTSMIRSWNRISVFIAFASFSVLFLLIQMVCTKGLSTRGAKVAIAAASFVLVAIGLFDQTSSYCERCQLATKEEFRTDRNFIREIERTLPNASAVYQLPYMPFPETPPLHNLNSYVLSMGFANSKTLRWSYGGIEGRAGDHFYRSLATEPVEKQIDVVRRLGFRGIYIDRRGYADHGDAIVDQFTRALGYPPKLVRSDRQVAFFAIEPFEDVDLDGLSDEAIMQKAGYAIDRFSARYPGTLEEGIDFSRAGLPDFILDIAGLLRPEAWGRWSDQRLARTVRIDFKSPLPEKFTLVLRAKPSAANIDKNLLIRVGPELRRVKMSDGVNEMRVPFDLGAETVDHIEFIPPKFARPSGQAVGNDDRELGVGFVSLRFE
ncbi:MAG: hypothetical protein KDJ86_20010 [Bauldia sp.]|uniref:DUF7024 domain-containing protein n=1 Tax=Bauldia sp. TaxID=2575872 RepID=UPI001D772FE9|nr:hypothetical protein [Bauldia sp.]MCB1498080.1 hypothetical protein [Bauldia sp.]